jgi:hypothetical protein
VSRPVPNVTTLLGYKSRMAATSPTKGQTMPYDPPQYAAGGAAPHVRGVQPIRVQHVSEQGATLRTADSDVFEAPDGRFWRITTRDGTDLEPARFEAVRKALKAAVLASRALARYDDAVYG